MGATEAKGQRGLAAGDGCPACGSAQLESFYEVRDVPVNSCILMSTREQALTYPKGEIDLHYCHGCGFVFNARFDQGLIEYSGRYEETQGYSGTFNSFHKRLAEQLIARHDLHDKDILEIGCGKGEFLTLICEMGENRGTGFDPSYVAERSRAPSSERTTFITDFYSERYADYGADLLCCKMTLEHIPQVAGFVSMVRAAVGDRSDTIVFFQVPETSIILEDCRFWDIYYEHCSYFGRRALTRLFQECGFQVTDTWVDYDNQYLMIEALPSDLSKTARSTGVSSAPDEAAAIISRFAATVPSKIARWKTVIEERRSEGKRIMLWGSGSKAVSFLTTLGIEAQVRHVVDINPHRQGMYMPGSGQQIVAPAFLKSNPPDMVIIMNPVYRLEISESLETLGLAPEILTL